MDDRYSWRRSEPVLSGWAVVKFVVQTAVVACMLLLTAALLHSTGLFNSVHAHTVLWTGAAVLASALVGVPLAVAIVTKKSAWIVAEGVLALVALVMLVAMHSWVGRVWP